MATDVLLNKEQKNVRCSPRMETSLINRLQLTLLALVTLVLLALAGLNFWQERHSQLPDDGVWWREAANGSGLLADKVLPDTPGERAGIKANDLLTGVSVLPVAGLHSSIKPQVPLTAVKESAGRSRPATE